MRLPAHLVRTQDGVCLAWNRTGPAKALLQVIRKDPAHVLKALSGAD